MPFVTSNLFIILVITFVNVCICAWNIGSTLKASTGRGGDIVKDEHTYISDDYPLTYPIRYTNSVAMTLQETVRFELNATDTVANAEWKHLTEIPDGLGRVHLGPEYRMFVITVYHQMHCLRKIAVGLRNRSDPLASYNHVRHCFNYLRQTFLCSAADMLEEGDFLQKNYEVDRVGDTLICQDWEQLYSELDQNYAGWLQWSENWN